jgi:hypothetical protein
MTQEMPGIANLSVEQFRARVNRFNPSFVKDWNEWHETLRSRDGVANRFGKTLRRWQACRPNRMRRTRQENLHSAPFLEDLIAQSSDYLQSLQEFCVGHQASLNERACQALKELWEIFKHLSYQGRARDGLAGVVGISKAVLLLTEGRVGPAFDSLVRGNLGIQEPCTADAWICALRVASQDIEEFERNNKCTLQQASPPPFAELQTGRLYDMALGPGV